MTTKRPISTVQTVTRRSGWLLGAAGVLAVVALGVGQSLVGDVTVVEAQGKEAPMFEVDPFWPRPLPNHWILGSAIGVGVDAEDHVWIVHRGSVDTLGANEIPAALDPPRAGMCCFPAPPVLEFDTEGNVVGSWGGPGDGYTWPSSNHGITIDHMDNVWIGGNGQGDSHVLKFTRDGRFLLQIGEAGHDVDSNSRTHYSRVANALYRSTPMRTKPTSRTGMATAASRWST